MTDKYSFNDENEVKAQFVKWGKVNDGIIGTLIGRRQVPNNLSETNELQWQYEIRAKSGSFHGIEDGKTVAKATEISEGGIWTVSGKKGIDDRMRNIAEGTVVGFKYVEERPSKKAGYNPTKVIKVYDFGPDRDAEVEEEAAEEVPEV